MNPHEIATLNQIVNQTLRRECVVVQLPRSTPAFTQYHVIVGEKLNPAYDPAAHKPGYVFNPQTDVLDLSKQPEMVPDVRILNLTGMESAQEIVQKLQPIVKTLPENRMSKISDTPMATIGAPQPAPVAMPSMSEAMMAAAAAPVTDQPMPAPSIDQNIPHPQDDPLTAIAEMLSNLSDRLDHIEAVQQGAVERAKISKPVKK